MGNALSLVTKAHSIIEALESIWKAWLTPRCCKYKTRSTQPGQSATSLMRVSSPATRPSKVSASFSNGSPQSCKECAVEPMHYITDCKLRMAQHHTCETNIMTCRVSV